jgi:hypothetical protein
MSEKSDNCHDWEAWLDTQPPSPHSIHVKGTCEFTTTGYSVELRPSEPQGFNPEVLMLDKVVHEPTGQVNQVIDQVPVEYSSETSIDYKQVHIQPDGPILDVRVIS